MARKSAMAPFLNPSTVTRYPQGYKVLTGVFFLFAVILRLLLFAANPPDNSFDDHFEPIFLIMEEGAIPLKTACWECFQPPIFYIVSATVGNAAEILTNIDPAEQLKLFQFLPCLYGILTVWIIYLILNRVRISSFARLLAFGTVCFLPRHIYMSAMHTNDTLSYLLVSLCVYLMLVVIDRLILPGDVDQTAGAQSFKQVASVDRSLSSTPISKTALLVLALMILILLSLFTKSTALVLLPMVAIILAFAAARRAVVPWRQSAVIFASLFLVPFVAVGSIAISDMKNYGQPFPLNIELLNVNLTQPPGRENIDFFSFEPWTAIRTPILAPSNLGSFWTLITGRMWFDMEPMFLQFTDPDHGWWDAYDDYLNRHDRYEWPGYSSLSPFTRLTGSALIAFGLLPLLFILIGVARALLGKWALWSKTSVGEVIKVQLFLVLLLFNLAGIILHTFRYPFYSFMKAAFLLNSLAAFALFLALGVMLVEKHRAVKWGISVAFAFAFILVTIHVLHIVQALVSV